MTDAELVHFSDLVFIESLREEARWCAGGEAAESADLLLVASATRLPAGPFNAMIATRAAAAPEALDRAKLWFDARARGFTVYVRGARDAALLELPRSDEVPVVRGAVEAMIAARQAGCSASHRLNVARVSGCRATGWASPWDR